MVRRESDGSLRDHRQPAGPLTALRRSEYHPSAAQARGHWEWEVASGVVTWSDALYRIFDVSAEEIAPSYEAFFRRIHPAHRVRAEGLVQATFVDGQARVFDCPLSTADGDERWIRADCAVEADAAGAPIRMRGTVQGLTDLEEVDATACVGEGDASLHDPLTGAANWQQFADRADAALPFSWRYSTTTWQGWTASAWQGP